MNEGRDYVNYGLTCEVEIRATNILCAADLGCPMNLTDIADKLPNTIFDPSKMQCVTMRHRRIGDGRCVALIFSSGYMSVNGSRSVSEAKCNLRRFARLLQKIGYGVKLTCIKIQSISAFARLPETIKPNLDYVIKNLGGSYEPELINAVCLQVDGMCMLVFHSGGIVLTGLRFGRGHRDLVHRIVNNIVMNGIRLRRKWGE